MMRRLPVLLVGVFLTITLARVAEFSARHMQAGALGWLFAVGLGAAVYTASYWTRTATTRKQAMTALVFFVGVDAYFNFADVWLAADTSINLVAVGAVLYGLFPTLATALLGWMSGAIAKLPPDAAQRNAASARARASNALSAWIERMTAQPSAQPIGSIALVERSDAQPSATPAQHDATHAHVCAVCGYTARNQQALAAHLRTHKRKEG
jgi:hypothetical protein